MVSLAGGVGSNTPVDSTDIEKLSKELKDQANSTAAQQMQTSYDQLKMSAIQAKTTQAVNVSNSAKGVNDKVQI